VFVWLALVVILALAVLDLWVGVSNDAANFLNSAIGSRVASRRTIVVVASFGVVLGAISSSGMMEVARKGVFNPDRFLDPSGALVITAILSVYLGVMAADVLMLDLFNTFGLPTSTTVSIISELVGASIAVSLWMHPDGLIEGLAVINTGPVLGIYGGIFLSVVIAFWGGALVMFLVRLVYGHDLESSFRRYGWLWTGVAFVAIAEFVLFKGLRKSVLLAGARGEWVGDNKWLIGLVVFVAAAACGVIWRHQHRKVLGVIVLCGTGALAMAFAGNDLVNFIGPSVAAAQAVLVEDVQLSGEVPTPTFALLAAGLIMVAALWRSKKARRVSDTEVRLAAHSDISQRFKTNAFARALVSWATTFWNLVRVMSPTRVRHTVHTRTLPPAPAEGQAPYDILRATVNLTVASLLITAATARKLPLSTTYITFMTAMGASLADRNWPMESADQRVAGVLTVIGGWVVTGFLAACGGFVMASIIFVGGSIGLLAASVAVGVALWRMSVIRGSGDETAA
jgi:phosphate/sulfate permease